MDERDNDKNLFGDDFLIPPTPTRIRISSCDISTEADTTTTSVIEEHEDSLAALTGEVVQAQQYQSNELSKKTEKLNELKSDLQLKKRHHDFLQTEIDNVNRQLYMVQNRTVEGQEKCTSLQHDIMELLKRKKVLQSKCLDLKWRKREINTRQLKYLEKMRTFRSSVYTYHENTDICIHNVQLRECVRALNEKLETLSKQEEEVIVQHQSTKQMLVDLSLKNERELLAVESFEKQIVQEKEIIAILKKEIDALHKRNVAQMNRMKCQLRDSTERSSRWRNENNMLQSKIILMKQKL